MASFETEAVVLKQFDLGESDRLITLYTKEKGKLKAVAKGARKGNKSRSGLVLPFSVHNFVLYQGRSLAKINHIESSAFNPKLREDLDYMAYANTAAEYFERAGLEDEPDEALFSLLVLTLENMNKSTKKDLLFHLTVLQAKLLLLMGVKPELENCTVCGNKMNLKGRTALSVEEGGSVCRSCFNTDKNDYYFYTLNEMRALYMIIFAGMSELKAEKFSKHVLEKIEKLTQRFLAYHLDLRPKSLDFLYTIRSMSD